LGVIRPDDKKIETGIGGIFAKKYGYLFNPTVNVTLQTIHFKKVVH